MISLREALAEATLLISRRDAEVLAAHVLGRPRTWVLSYPDVRLAPEPLAALRALVERRDGGEPLQYLTGRQEFFGLDFKVTRDTLIPRPETEHLVEAVLRWAAEQAEPQAGSVPRRPPLRVLDVGTGTGAIALALATHLPRVSARPFEIAACDLSPAALAVARSNAAQLGVADRVRFEESDLLAAFAGDIAEGARFDAIVSNPPYIAEGDGPTLQPEVRDHEPPTALFGGPDGLAVYRRLIPEAAAALRPGGLLALEIGFGQADDLWTLLRDWAGVQVLDDYAGIPRVVLAQRA